MAKPEWGTKRTCYSCGARFYDLRRDPIICPVCNSAYDPARQPKPRRSSPNLRDEPVLVPGLADEEAEAEVNEDALDEEVADADLDDLEDTAEAGSSGEEGEIIEDASELGEDDDDIGEVMEHVDDELDEKP